MVDWGRGDSYRHQKRQGGGRQGERGGGGGGPTPWCSSKFERPPRPDSWHPTVPNWEKQFCYQVGNVSWKKICETQILVSIYKNIAEWDDSAVEETFHNEKARYWAQINGYPCDIPLPDPDMYINDVDWDAKIDPELLLNLDRCPPAPSLDDKEKENNTVCQGGGWESLVPSDEPIIPTGWEVDEDRPSQLTGWVIGEDASDKKSDNRNNGTMNSRNTSGATGCVDWENKVDKGNNGTVNGRNTPPAMGWEKWDKQDKLTNGGCIVVKAPPAETSWGNDGLVESTGWDDGAPADRSWVNEGGLQESSLWSHKKDNILGWTEDADHCCLDPGQYRKKRDCNNGWRYSSRDTNPWHGGGDNHHLSNNNRRNCRGRRRMSHATERGFDGSQTLSSQKWNSSHPCRPVNQQVTCETGGGWYEQRHEKPVW